MLISGVREKTLRYTDEMRMIETTFIGQQTNTKAASFTLAQQKLWSIDIQISHRLVDG